MATKNLAGQLRAAKLEIATLKAENADLRTSWMDELNARSRDSRELELAHIQG